MWEEWEGRRKERMERANLISTLLRQILFLYNLFVPLKAHTLRSETIFGNCKPFKNDEKRFLFHLKSSFHFQDI